MSSSGERGRSGGGAGGQLLQRRPPSPCDSAASSTHRLSSSPPAAVAHLPALLVWSLSPAVLLRAQLSTRRWYRDVPPVSGGLWPSVRTAKSANPALCFINRCRPHAHSNSAAAAATWTWTSTADLQSTLTAFALASPCASSICGHRPSHCTSPRSRYSAWTTSSTAELCRCAITGCRISQTDERRAWSKPRWCASAIYRLQSPRTQQRNVAQQ